MDTIFTYISEHYPTIGLIIAAVAIVGFVVYKATMYHVSIQRTREKVDELPCSVHATLLNSHIEKLDRIGNILDKIDAKFDAIDTKFEAHKDVLVGICVALGNKKMLDPVTALKKLSPYTLTVEGEKQLVASGGKACIDANLEYFLSELEKRNPQNALDVETEAIDVIWGGSRKPFFNDIKNYIFLDPEGISLLTTITAMGIYLRDKYFEIHPELLPEGVQMVALK